MSEALQPSRDLDIVMEEMEGQRNVQIVHEQRIASLETRTTVIEVRQNQLDSAMVKQANALTDLAIKATIHDAAIDQLKQGNELHARHIEDIDRKHGDEIKELIKERAAIDKKVDAVESKVTVIWKTIGAIGGTLVLVVLEYIFAHYLPK